MSSKSKRNNVARPTKTSKKEWATRILALFLAIITILGIVMMVVPTTETHDHNDSTIVYDTHETVSNDTLTIPVAPQVPNNNTLVTP